MDMEESEQLRRRSSGSSKELVISHDGWNCEQQYELIVDDRWDDPRSIDGWVFVWKEPQDDVMIRRWDTMDADDLLRRRRRSSWLTSSSPSPVTQLEQEAEPNCRPMKRTDRV